ncbi:hypothetical protein GCM10009541_59350 [Micromonospora gifhornensis]|uniref:Leucine-binding protein domain-containing protein n=1 Tax=Micromonospora gifhornensis TaxID=84594 RepID=A0ABQ4IMK5_9ACTN|nr:ABC transporter substrate-binding protein [Micromonospora gifhornensis]GIJ19041.1 hypothetical protein Vgi01_57250 [Micromonospora gifhornensis]
MQRARARLRHALAAVTATSLLATGVACGSGAGDSDRVRIGLLVSLSGIYTSVGEDMRRGFQLYLDTHDGRLGGRDIDLVVADG